MAARRKPDAGVWEDWAQRDPYYAVLSADEFRSPRMDAGARQRFFDSGEQHIQKVLERAAVLCDWQGGRGAALDYGCGLGRLVMPLARRFQHVVGVDVSETMLAEARRNCAAAGLDNVRLVSVPDFGPGLGEFDFVHSFNVLQHIPVRAGMQIVSELVALLRPGRVGVLHFPFEPQISAWKQALYTARLHIRPIHALLNRIKGRPTSDPPTLMNSYSLHAVFRLLIAAGVEQVAVELTEDGPWLQSSLYFVKPAVTPP